jgi:alpha-D-xyloside xylohydrolase
VYLPSTTGWYDFYTGKYYEGGQAINAQAPLETVPLYVKEGSIVPFGPEIQYAMQPTDGTLKLLVYTGKDASFNIYEDEGINYNYEKGNFSTIPLNYSEGNKTLEIGNRSGKFEGMAVEREIQIYFIEKADAKLFNLNSKADRTIKYNGTLQSISITK